MKTLASSLLRSEWLRTAALSLAVLAAGAAHAADLLDDVKARGALRVGVEGTYPPFNYKDEQGKLTGFDVEIAEGIAAKLGVKAEFTTTEWSGILAGLQAGKYDVIVNQVAATDKRRETFDFSDPYVVSSPQLIVRANETRKLDTPADLKGKKIGVGQGSNYADLAKGIDGAEVKTYPGATEYLQDLATGRIDAHQRQPAHPLPGQQDQAAGEGRHAAGPGGVQRHPLPQGQPEVQGGDRQGPGRHEGRRVVPEDFHQVLQPRREQAAGRAVN